MTPTPLGRVVAAVALAAVLAAVPSGTAPADPGTTATVQRLAGPERAATAAAVALEGWTAAPTVVLADGTDPVGALVAAHLAARRDAPLLLSGAEVPAVTDKAAARLGAQIAVVVGHAAVPDGIPAQRITAATPPQLAAAAVQAHPGPADLPVVLASQATFADALAAANLAPTRLLLTDPQVLSAATAEALDRLAPPEVVVMGGPAAIDDAVVQAVTDRGPSVRRLAGADRYGTALGAARPGQGPAVIVSGEGFADAVAAVPWAGRHAAAVLLTPHRELPAGVADHLRARQPARVLLLGGTAAIGNFAERQAAAATAGLPPPGFVGHVRPLTDAERTAMTGPVWREGCPVGLDALRVVQLAHFDLTDNVVDDGRLVVHVDHADDVLDVMAQLFDARFPLAQVRPVEAFDGDDDASMAANNSSGFNCRTVAGTQRWSEHAYGRAVDLNPVQNPYVRGDLVAPPAGRAYLDRDDVRPGMIVRPGPVVDAFAAIGWGWGGDFVTADDYQHFSATGR